MRREEQRLHRVKLVGKAGFGVGELEGGVLFLPGDADTPAGGHHHRLDHMDLVPRNVRGSGERLEGRSLELEGDCTSSVDEHVKPASRSGQSETIVGGTTASINAHTNSDDPLSRRGDHSTADHRCSLLIVRFNLGVALHTFVSFNEKANLLEEGSRCCRWGFPQKHIHRVGEVNTHDVLSASWFRTAVAISTISQPISIIVNAVLAIVLLLLFTILPAPTRPALTRVFSIVVSDALPVIVAAVATTLQ
jgi:hypothetical protein